MLLPLVGNLATNLRVDVSSNLFTVFANFHSHLPSNPVRQCHRPTRQNDGAPLKTEIHGLLKKELRAKGGSSPSFPLSTKREIFGFLEPVLHCWIAEKIYELKKRGQTGGNAICISLYTFQSAQQTLHAPSSPSHVSMQKNTWHCFLLLGAQFHTPCMAWKLITWVLNYYRILSASFFSSLHQMALLSALRQIAGISAGPLSDALKAELYTLVLGTFSLPINIPGTNYSKGLQVLFAPCMPENIREKLSRIEPSNSSDVVFQARKKLVAMLRQMIIDRRSSGCTQDDMLDSLLSGNEGTRAKLSDDQIIDLLITLIYSGYETVSTTSMMAVKYLSDNPKALEQIRVHIYFTTLFSSKRQSPIILELTGDLLAVAERTP